MIPLKIYESMMRELQREQQAKLSLQESEPAQAQQLEETSHRIEELMAQNDENLMNVANQVYQ